MRLSSRIRQIVPSGDDGWGVYYTARALAASGERVVNLTIGDHDVGPDTGILDALRASLAAGHTGYTPVEGTAELRAAIAAAEPVPTRPEEIAVTCGAQAGLYAAMTAALDPGESCVVLDPYYATYDQTVRAVGAVPLPVRCRPEDGFQPDPEAIAAALRPDTRAILVNTPNNPSGAVYDTDCLAAIGALAERHNLTVISDEVYETMVWEGRHVSARAVPGLAERSLRVMSFSKSYGLTGFRVGWIAGPEEAVQRIADLAVTTTYGLPGFIQDAGVHALTAGAAAAAEITARYGARRRAALAALEGATGCRAVAPAGGMYVLVDIRETGMTGEAFAERLLAEHSIAVMPGESFGQAAAGHLRVALTRPEADLVPALERMAAQAEAACALPVGS